MPLRSLLYGRGEDVYMLPLLSLLSLAQSPPIVPRVEPPAIAQTTQQTIEVPGQVRPLPGELDTVPVFNSNSPELVQTEGILLSTFPPRGMATPSAHLDYTFNGRFDLFSHHVVRGQTADDTRTLYVGVIVHNPGRQAVTLTLREGASYLSQEAPWQELASTASNLTSTNFSGPGSRLMNDILRDRRQPHWPTQIEIPAGESRLLMNVPIPLRRLTVATDGTLPAGSVLLPPPEQSKSGASEARINARSTLMRLSSSGPVHLASLAMFAPATPDGGERVPSLEEWQRLLMSGDLAGPRDRAPTPPNEADRANPFLYGRVSGVARGSSWVAKLTDSANSDHLSIPAPGDRISYVLSTVDRNTFGTGQIQSAPMLVRYPDTAYRAHGNYGIEYSLDVPLYNNTDQTQTVTLSVETPLQNESLSTALQFQNPPDSRVFFRGTVLFLYTDDSGRSRANYTHLVQRRGQQGEPLVRLELPPGDRRRVQVQFLYPPDATPPQVLTIETVADSR